jgi:hypothetical protein
MRTLGGSVAPRSGNVKVKGLGVVPQAVHGFRYPASC